MKKIFAFAVSVLAASVIFSGCGQNSKYTEGTIFEEGTTSGRTYENSSAGIGFNLPDGFEFSEDYLAAPGAVIDIHVSDESRNSIIVSVDPGAKRLDMDKSLEKSLEAIEAQFDDLGFTVKDSGVTQYTIGDNIYGGFFVDSEYLGQDITQLALLVKCDDKIVSYTISGFTIDAEDILNEYFFAIE